jgi:hypothetical protein
MPNNHGSKPLGSLVEGMWSTTATTGESISRGTDGVIRLYRDSLTSERSSSAGITDTENFDGVVGVHQYLIDTSDNTDPSFYEVGHTYFITLIGAVIDGKTINAVLGTFTIDNVLVPEDSPTGGQFGSLQFGGSQFDPGQFGEQSVHTTSTQFYCVRKDIELIYGKTNVKTWADVDNNGILQDITDRVDWAIENSYHQINDILLGGPYIVPFEEPFPIQIITESARLAGVMLYDSRGITDFSEDGKPLHQLAYHRNMTDQFIKKILARQIRLQGQLDVATTIPGIVNSEDD